MASADVLVSRIEALRRQMHAEMTGSYDPVRLQALLPLAQEIDRLTLALERRQADGESRVSTQAISA